MDENELFEENIKLVYFALQPYKLNYEDYKDYKQVGLIGLWKASKTYNENMNTKFSTYALFIIRNEIFMEFRKTKKTNKDISINSPTNDGETTIEDMLSSGEDLQQNYDVLEIIERFKKSKYKEVLIDYYINNLTQKEIAEKNNWYQSYVTRVIKAEVKKIREEMKK